jgi:hypothetical protein
VRGVRRGGGRKVEGGPGGGGGWDNGENKIQNINTLYIIYMYT